MSDIQYEPSWGSVFLAMAKDEHLPPEPTPSLHWPVTCPNCLSEDTKPVDENHDHFECTTCGEIFCRPN